MAEALQRDNPHPNQMGQSNEGGDRKRRRRNAIYPNSAAAAVIVEARTSFLLSSLPTDVAEIGIDDDAAASRGTERVLGAGDEDERSTEELTPAEEAASVQSDTQQERTQRFNRREISTDDIIEGPRDTAGGETMVSSQQLGWSSDEDPE